MSFSRRCLKWAAIATAVIAAMMLVSAAAQAGTIHVPGDFPTIQAAIDAAVNGDEIVVASGTYNETIDFLGKAINLHSSAGPQHTIIDAKGSGTVVTCTSGEGPATVLAGFSITGGFANEGGGMLNVASSPTVTRCSFIGNTAVYGGGMANCNASSPRVTNCTFSGNTSRLGGGMCNQADSNPTVTNCTFSDNLSAHGGGMYNDASSPTVINCIMYSYRNGPGGIVDTGGAATTVNHSNVQGGWFGAGSNNINTDPMYFDPDGPDEVLGTTDDNLRLMVGSTSIDAGDNNTVVPYGIVTDLDGCPRFVDEPITPDCLQAPGECGDPPVVDMGAYESSGSGWPCHWGTCSCCPWDLSCDGTVGILDLLTVLAAWGQPPHDPVGLNGDCTVGILDLLALLANWGPCT